VPVVPSLHETVPLVTPLPARLWKISVTLDRGGGHGG
jgi:hypothetical protein